MLLMIAGLALVPFILIVGPIWFFGRRRISWTHWDLHALWLPLLLWWMLLVCDGQKSFSNLIEPLWIGALLPASTIVRVSIGKRFDEHRVALAILIALCAISIGIYRFTPFLPE